VDSTAVETDIHHPTDSTLLLDGIRVMTRWLACGKDLRPQPVYVFSDHTRVAKKRVVVILNARKDALRKAAYRDLLAYAARVAGYAEAAIPELRSFQGSDPRDLLIVGEWFHKDTGRLVLFKRLKAREPARE
jgi:IS5 family transposase